MRSFRELLANRAARAFVVAGFVGRLPMGMLGVGIILLVSARTGSYGVAGAAGGTYAVSQAIGAPVLGRLVDSYGQARALVPAVLVHVAAVGAMVGCLVAGVRPWVLIVSAAATGVTLPPVGSLVRARWMAAVGGTPRLPTAMALESTLDELVFVAGPPLVSVLVVAVHPLAGLTGAALLALAGCAALAVQRHTEPTIRPDRARRRLFSAIRQPALALTAAVFLAIGGVSGAAGLAVVVVMTAAHAVGLSGLLLACFASGAMVGGLWYGSKPRRSPLRRQFMSGAAAITVSLVPAVVVTDPRALFAMLFVTGAVIAPTMIAGFALVADVVPADVATEGLTWISAASAAGVAAGAWLAGQVAEATHDNHVFLVPLASAALATVVAASGRSVFGRGQASARPLEQATSAR